jgi:hypothetical protein
MSWLLISALVWVAVSVPTALLLGRAMRSADGEREGETTERDPSARGSRDFGPR